MASLTSLLRFVVAAVIIHVIYGGVNEVPLPTIDLNEWWGPGNATAQDTSIKNFTITFNQTMIDDLRYRLQNHRPFVAPLEGIVSEYGNNHNDLLVWIQYLKDTYPFQDRLAILNQYPHYTTYIQGLKMHFMRAQSSNMTGKVVIPLVICHGFPGSFREFLETIPYLLKNAEAQGFALDIIVPSLPGFGFSDGAAKTGLGVDKVAIVIRNLINKLGYTRYVLQGGDMGALVTMNLATFFPNEVIGYHTNFAFVHTYDMIFELLYGNFHQSEIAESNHTSQLYPSTKIFFDIMTRFGYLHIQATKPDTYGVGFSDSPSGLIAHFFRSSGVPGNTGTLIDELKLCDNFMIYWSSNCAITAMRLYAETFNKRYVALRMNEIKTPVPTWTVQTPNELFYLPPWMLKAKFPNLIGNTEPSVGGHFYAWEYPKEFADNVVNAIVAFNAWNTMNSTYYDECSMYINN